MRLDASRLLPGLYQGSVPASAEQVMEHGFSVLVLCAVEIQPMLPSFAGLTVLRCPLIDNPDVPLSEPDWEQAVATGCEVARLVASGQRSLCTCAMGWNRSGLVSGIALHVLTGMPGTEAVEYIRQKRSPKALSNPQFVARLARLRRQHR